MTPKLLAALAVLGLLVGACGGSGTGSDSGSKASATTAAGAPAADQITATLSGSGSTFQKSYDEAVIEAFKKVQPKIALSYSGGGSGKGKTDLAQAVDQWAGTDSLVKDADVPTYAKGLLYWPIVAGPITLSYNLPSVAKLTLDADTTAKIFQGDIKTWDDAAIKALNPGVSLPSTKISPVHRSDASGTTTNFTKWLSAASTAGVAKLTAGDSNNGWPTDQVAGNGNAGVATAVKQTAGAIGYVDYSDAKASGLSFASVKNKAGKVVAPSLDGTSAALAKTTIGADLTYNPLNADGDDSYPIATPTWIITQKTYTDANVVNALKAFLSYVYGPGQDLAKDIDFAKLPADYVTKAKAQLDVLTVG